MTRYSDREDGVEDPVAYQDAEPVFPIPRGLGLSPDLQPRPTVEQLIEFENVWPGNTGAKEAAIRTTFNLGAVRYYQLVNRMIDLPSALELDPTLIYRLRDQRKARVTARRSLPGRTPQ